MRKHFLCGLLLSGYCSVLAVSASAAEGESSVIDEKILADSHKIISFDPFIVDLGKLQKAFNERQVGTNSIDIDGLVIESRHSAKLNAFCGADINDLKLIQILLPKPVLNGVIKKFTVSQSLNFGVGKTYTPTSNIMIHFYVFKRLNQL
jgi:hypothetical protein